MSSPIVVNGTLYVMTVDGFLYAFDLSASVGVNVAVRPTRSDLRPAHS
jgi:outer membrane protein assembly factor BamB